MPIFHNNKIYMPVKSCFGVTGACRGMLYDLQRESYDFIPNDLALIFEHSKNNDIEISNNGLNLDSNDLNYLLKKEYLFEVDEFDIDCFPDLETDYYHSSVISNAIIICSNKTFSYLYNIITQLEELGCRHVSIMFNEDFDLPTIYSHFSFLTVSSIAKIDIYIKNTINITSKGIINFKVKHPAISTIYLYGSENTEIFIEIGKNVFSIFLKEDFRSLLVPKIDIDYFEINISTFTEAQNHNLYFHGKVVIDSEGEIKNSWLQKESFGNIFEDDLESVISSLNFLSLGKIKKDNVIVCQQCEFRYCCLDGDILEEISEKGYKRTTECNYNPFIAKWAGEEHYLTLSECNIHLNNGSLTINEDFLSNYTKSIYND